MIHPKVMNFPIKCTTDCSTSKTKYATWLNIFGRYLSLVQVIGWAHGSVNPPSKTILLNFYCVVWPQQTSYVMWQIKQRSLKSTINDQPLKHTLSLKEGKLIYCSREHMKEWSGLYALWWPQCVLLISLPVTASIYSTIRWMRCGQFFVGRNNRFPIHQVS